MELKTFQNQISFHSEHEDTYQENCRLLDACSDYIAYIARECEVHAIRLISVREMKVEVIANGRAANAQAVSGLSCFLRYHQSGIQSVLIMLPTEEHRQLAHEIIQLRGELALEIHIGAQLPPARLFPVLICALGADPQSEEARHRVMQAAKRLQHAAGRRGTGQQVNGGHTAAVNNNWHQMAPGRVSSPWGPVGQQARLVMRGHNGISGAAIGLGTGLAIGQVFSTATALQGAEVGLRSIPGLGTTRTFLSVPLVLSQSVTILYQYFDLAPVEGAEGGADFFQIWSQATFGTREEAFRVRQSLVLTFSLHADLQSEVEKLTAAVAINGVHEYFRRIHEDHTFLGTALEVAAASRFDNTLTRIFDAKSQVTYSFSPPTSAIPTSREVNLLYYEGFYWLLESSTAPTAMETTVDYIRRSSSISRKGSLDGKLFMGTAQNWDDEEGRGRVGITLDKTASLGSGDWGADL